MAVKVIKPGKTEFCGFCDRCGCEFSYELVDIQLTGKTNCPMCGKDYYHPMRTQYPERLEDIKYPLQFLNIDATTDSCAECEWLKELRKKGSYVGDTPCTWCTKNKFISNECANQLSALANSGQMIK